MAGKAQLLQRLERLERLTPKTQELTKAQMFAALYDPMHEDYQ
jgi:hypothetical protein